MSLSAYQPNVPRVTNLLTNLNRLLDKVLVYVEEKNGMRNLLFGENSIDW
jgi:hypothetical protein